MSTGQKPCLAIRSAAAEFAAKYCSLGHVRQGKAGAEALDIAADALKAEGIVYLLTDATGKIAPYGGQAINDARQREHNNAFPEAKFVFDQITSAAPGKELDIAEHNFIQELPVALQRGGHI